MRICKICLIDKPKECFSKKDKSSGAYKKICKECYSNKANERRRIYPFAQRCRVKKVFCKKNNLPFDITPKYLESIWTGKCPIFDIDLDLHSNDRSYHLDRITPELGYTKGNVVYLSRRANMLKSNASLNEIELVYSWMKVQLESSTTISKESTLQTIGSGSGEPLETE